MMDYDIFLAKYYSTAGEQKIDDIKRFLSNVESLLGEKDPQESFKDKGFLCKTFFLQKASSISRPHYQKIKEYLINLLDYFNIEMSIPSREEVLESQEVIAFFKDLDSLLDFIDKIGADKLQGYNPIKDLAYIKSIVILGWYGFTTQEIASMPKRNLMYISGGTFRVFRPNSPDREYVDVSQRAFDILSYLQDCEGYRSLPYGKYMPFKGDDYFLFRPTRGDQEVTEATIIQTIKRFNKEIPSTSGVTINFRNLKKNALFVAVYEDKSDESATKKIMRHMNCSLNLAIGFNKQYYRWVEIFHNN